MIVIISRVAERDLEEIGDYIARDNPRRAMSYMRDLRDRCETIAAAPQAAPPRDDVAAGIRMVVHGNYLIFYRVAAPEIRIERVLHGAREIKRLLSGD